jgi:hypothetical protein
MNRKTAMPARSSATSWFGLARLPRQFVTSAGVDSAGYFGYRHSRIIAFLEAEGSNSFFVVILGIGGYNQIYRDKAGYIIAKIPDDDIFNFHGSVDVEPNAQAWERGEW